MSRVDDGGQPRATIHKRILDAAASAPDASLADIADGVSGATPDLVERVLDEYGDPATMNQNGESPPETEETAATPGGDEGSTPEQEPSADATGDGAASVPEPEPTPEPADLTEKQRETLRAVHAEPDAGQSAVAEELGVTRATVSRRLNDIPGFEWSDRGAFASEVFDEPAGTDEAGADEGDEAGDAGAVEDAGAPEEETDAEPGGVEPAAVERRLDSLEAQVDAVEREVAATDDAGADGAADAALPPELAHKVVHACMESDRVDEEEELRLLRALLS